MPRPPYNPLPLLRLLIELRLACPSGRWPNGPTVWGETGVPNGPTMWPVRKGTASGKPVPPTL
jgi:hypothetical protein